MELTMMMTATTTLMVSSMLLLVHCHHGEEKEKMLLCLEEKNCEDRSLFCEISIGDACRLFMILSSFREFVITLYNYNLMTTPEDLR
jgi:hypothetical protein